MLIEEKVPTPGYLNFIRFGTFSNIYAGVSEEKSYTWTIAQVKSILKDETYIGNTVHYRETNVSYKNKHRIRKDKDEWLCIENIHEATNQIFAGLVKCADCGWSLGYSTHRSKSNPYKYYKCSRYGQMGKKYCTNHFIRYDILYAYVLSRLRYWSSLAQTDEAKLLKRVKEADDRNPLTFVRRWKTH